MLKKIFFVFILSVLLIVSIGFVGQQVTQYIKKQTLEKYNEQQLVLAKQASYGISNFIENICKNLEFYSQFDSFQTKNMTALNPLLNRIYSRELLNIINLIIRYNNDPALIFYPNLINSPGFFMENLKKSYSSKTTVTNYFLILDNLPSIIINTPLINPKYPDRIYGYLSATVSLPRIDKLFIHPAVPGKKGEVYLLDKQGKILISSNKNFLGKYFFDTYKIENKDKYLNNKDNKFIDNISNTSYVIAHTPVKLWENQWHLIIMTPGEIALSNLQPWLQKIMRFILVITLLIILLYSTLSLIVMTSHKKEIKAIEKIKNAEERERLQNEIKKREEFLSNILASTQDIVFAITDNGNFTFENQKFIDVSGVSADGLKKKNIYDYLNKNDGDYLKNELKNFSYGSKPLMKDVTLTFNNKDYSFLFSIAPIRFYGDDSRFVCVATDITELKELQARLFQSDKMATLGTMAGGIAHEINNPLCSVLGFAKMGLSKSAAQGNENLQKYFKSIYSAADHSKKIIDSLLKYATQSSFDFHSVDIKSVLNDSIMLLDKKFESSNIKLIKSIPDKEYFIIGDESQIQQVFTNLMINAINAMPDGGELNISLSENENNIIISFSDSGRGIPEENLSKIFDPFFTTKAVWSGTGLGLSISHTIIKEHKGSIQVESVINKGSNFKVILPLIKNKN